MKKSSRRGRRHREIPWGFITVVLMVGAFVGFLMYLSQQQEHKASGPIASLKERMREAASGPVHGDQPVMEPATPDPHSSEKKPMTYDFYTRLPKFEVEVPEEKGDLRTKPLEKPGSYVLQAGSFRNARDAEARKAELALLGIVATVHVVTLDGKLEYHRVRIGPYRDLNRLNKTRQTLRENNIEFVTLQERS